MPFSWQWGEIWGGSNFHLSAVIPAPGFLSTILCVSFLPSDSFYKEVISELDLLFQLSLRCPLPFPSHLLTALLLFPLLTLSSSPSKWMHHSSEVSDTYSLFYKITVSAKSSKFRGSILGALLLTYCKSV